MQRRTPTRWRRWRGLAALAAASVLVVIALCALFALALPVFLGEPMAPEAAANASRVEMANAAEPARTTALQRDPVAAAPAVTHVADREQRVRCLDEQGAVLAGITVRLVRVPVVAGAAPLTAISDDDGQAVFASVPAGNYAVRASGQGCVDGRRLSDTVRTLPDAPFDLVLADLWVGGLAMPAAEVRSHGCAYHGFRDVDDFEAVNEWLAGSRARWPEPGVVLFAALRDTRHELVDRMPVRVLWTGHQWYEGTVAMLPARRFAGPEELEPTQVPAMEWARFQVVLTDRADAALPAAVQGALRSMLFLVPRSTPQDVGFTFGATGACALPCGEYVVQRYDQATSQRLPIGVYRIESTTLELRLVVPGSDRLVRLRLRGLGGPGYILEATHENGRAVREFGNDRGEHVLWLPEGACMLFVKRGTAREPDVAQRALVITDAAEQDVAWDVPPPRR